MRLELIESMIIQKEKVTADEEAERSRGSRKKEGRGHRNDLRGVEIRRIRKKGEDASENGTRRGIGDPHPV
jgi:hypothetical protein